MVHFSIAMLVYQRVMMFENNFHLQVVLDPLEPTTMAQKILDIWIIQSNDITTHGAGLVRQIFPKKYWKTKFNSAIRSTNIHKDVLSLINWLIFLAHNNTSPDQDVCTFVLIKDFSLQPPPFLTKRCLRFLPSTTNISPVHGLERLHLGIYTVGLDPYHQGGGPNHQ